MMFSYDFSWRSRDGVDHQELIVINGFALVIIIIIIENVPMVNQQNRKGKTIVMT